MERHLCMHNKTKDKSDTEMGKSAKKRPRTELVPVAHQDGAVPMESKSSQEDTGSGLNDTRYSSTGGKKASRKNPRRNSLRQPDESKADKSKEAVLEE